MSQSGSPCPEGAAFHDEFVSHSKSRENTRHLTWSGHRGSGSYAGHFEGPVKWMVRPLEQSKKLQKLSTEQQRRGDASTVTTVESLFIGWWHPATDFCHESLRPGARAAEDLFAVAMTAGWSAGCGHPPLRLISIVSAGPSTASCSLGDVGWTVELLRPISRNMPRRLWVGRGLLKLREMACRSSTLVEFKR